MSVSFKTDILPLFTQTDIAHMAELSVRLDDYSYMSQSDNASDVYGQVSSHSMPPAGSGEQPWTDQQVELFKTWIDDGCPP
jgi:hypothetical protein